VFGERFASFGKSPWLRAPKRSNYQSLRVREGNGLVLVECDRAPREKEEP